MRFLFIAVFSLIFVSPVIAAEYCNTATPRGFDTGGPLTIGQSYNFQDGYTSAWVFKTVTSLGYNPTRCQPIGSIGDLTYYDGNYARVTTVHVGGNLCGSDQIQVEYWEYSVAEPSGGACVPADGTIIDDLPLVVLPPSLQGQISKSSYTQAMAFSGLVSAFLIFLIWSRGL